MLGGGDIKKRKNLLRQHDDLRPIFEMHGVVVMPLAAPDEAMLLENIDDLPGNLVLVGKAAIGVGLGPRPVVRVRAGNIDRNAESVSALTLRPGDRTAIIGPLGRPQIRKELSSSFDTRCNAAAA